MTQVGFLCRRPACQQVAEVAVSFDATQCQLWLDTLTDASGGAQPLCEEHAMRITPPRGWVIVDRRAAQSSLVTAPSVDPPPRPRRRSPAAERQWGRFEAPTLQFDVSGEAPPPPGPAAAEFEPVEPVVEVPEEPEPVAEAEPAAEPAPAADRPEPRAATTLSGAKGRLLSRAFEASGVDEELSRKFFGTGSDQDS